jgi:hypothetical protein
MLVAPVGGIPGAEKGIYRVAAISGVTTGIAGAGVLFSALWRSTTLKALLYTLEVKMSLITPFTAAQDLGFDAVVGRSFTAAHTGGTAVNLTSNNNKIIVGYPSSGFTDMRVATTAALGGGTVTPDAQPFMAGYGGQALAAAAAQHSPVIGLYDHYAPNKRSIILSQDEGILVRNGVAQGAAGTVRFIITMEWIEFDATAP